MNENSDLLLEIKNLKKLFPVQTGIFEKMSRLQFEGKKPKFDIDYLHAVDGINLDIKKGTTQGLVGESGCGKTTTGRCLLRLIEPSSGEVFFENQEITSLNTKEFYPYRKKIQMIFQEPGRSLNPRDTAGEIIEEPLKVHGIEDNKETRKERVLDLMRTVGLSSKFYNRFPHKLSGGEKQRIMLARVLTLNPEFIVLDEPVAALDMSLKTYVLELLKELQEKFNLTYLFIAHNLSVVHYICDRIAVMYLGKIVEVSSTKEIFSAPVHPYTKSLLSSLPSGKTGKIRDPIELPGDVPTPINPGSGCNFYNRCPADEKGEKCRLEEPELNNENTSHKVACHYPNNSLHIDLTHIRNKN